MARGSKLIPTGPIIIPKNVKLLPNSTNTINVSWRNDFHKRFVISAYLVEKITRSQLLQRMKAKGIRPKEVTSALSAFHVLFILNSSFFTNKLNVNINSSSFYLVKEKFKGDGDCEIAATDLRVSLMCPIGKIRMSTPCR